MGLWQSLSTFLSGTTLQANAPGPDDDYWYSPRGRAVAAGVAVSEDSALQLTTVSSCVKVIAETVATLPIIVYREVAEGKVRAPEDPRSRLLRRMPNRWQSSLAWREMMTGHAALRGRAYAEMVGTSFANLELIPRHPDRVRVLETDGAGFPTVYGVRNVGQDTQERSVPRSKMFVLLGPWGGRSPVEAHREAIGLGLAMQQQAGRFFGNGTQLGGLLKSPAGTTFSKEQRETIKESWNAAHQGPQNAHRVAVLEGGLEWQSIGTTPEDSQFIQSRQFHVGDICRIWNVPPYKIQEYGRATWSNTEQMAIDFVTTCMLPWFRRWEEAISWYLIEEAEPIFAEFLVEGLLRGDTAVRFAAYQIASGGHAWMSPNEIRERESMNRLPGLDEVSTIPQGAAPGPTKPGAPMRETPKDDPEESARSGSESTIEGAEPDQVWQAWAVASAGVILNAELRAFKTVSSLEARDTRAFGEWCREFYLDRHRQYVGQRLYEMEKVWRPSTPYPAAVAQILADGAAWAVTQPRDAATRHQQILAVLTEGAPHVVAA